MRDNKFLYDKKTVRKRKIDERKLVNRILQGNERSLNFFYRHFYHSLYTFIAKKIKQPQDVEEILQDTFFAALEGLRDFQFKSSLFTFLCSIANHKVIDFYRKKKIKKIVFSNFVEVEPILAQFFGPEEAFDSEILKEKIRKTFNKLSPSYKKILKLKYIYGYSVEEIAEIMSVTFKSAESTLFRARKAFALSYKYEK